MFLLYGRRSHVNDTDAVSGHMGSGFAEYLLFVLLLLLLACTSIEKDSNSCLKTLVCACSVACEDGSCVLM